MLLNEVLTEELALVTKEAVRCFLQIMKSAVLIATQKNWLLPGNMCVKLGSNMKKINKNKNILHKFNRNKLKSNTTHKWV